MNWIIIFFLLASGIFKGCMDTLVFHYEGSIWEKIEKKYNLTYFRIFDNDKDGPGAWRNKNKFEGFLGWLMKGPLVAFTDGWHLFQFLCLSCWQIAFAILCQMNFHPNQPLYAVGYFVAIKVLVGAGFYVGWK